MPVLKRLFLFLSLIACIAVYAQQFFESKNYPKNFRNPVDIPVSLAGNFGECRPNHFHSGLDVRTNKVENIPVYAIGDGYVSRVKIEEKGFGNAIYINHLNGYTSLYAHLNSFYPELENFIRQKQYEQKSWKIDIQFLPHQFPIRKGSFIALSGNTGSSQAPHLHMEIRNTKTEKPLNGLLFYNYPDTKAPIFKKLGVYNTALSIYEQSPKQIAFVRKGSIYSTPKDTILLDGNEVGFSIQADDPMEGALGVLGVYEMNLLVDGKPHFGWQLDNIGYEETRYMNALADYKTKRNGGPWLQLCFKLPNDKLEVYKSFSKADGRVNISDGLVHEIKIVAKDTKGNSAVAVFHVMASGKNNSTAANTYFTAGKFNSFDDGNIALEIPNDVLYDKTPKWLSTEASSSPYSNLYHILRGDIPAHDTFEIKLKPKSITPDMYNKLVVVKLPYGNESNKKGYAAKFKNGRVCSFVREFGNYEITVDTTPPLVTTKLTNGADLSKTKRIIFTAKDETTSVQSFVGTIDGQWVRFVQRGNIYYYEMDKYCPSGNHVLVVKAVDENNNVKTVSLNFKN